MEAWIPEEKGSQVIQRVNAMSAVETYARRENMTTDTKSVPRSGGVGVEIVAKGSAYGEDESTNDDVTLKAAKFGKAIRIAEEDIEDSPADVIQVKQLDWATSYANALDNACLGVTGGIGAGVPFQSVYNAVRSADAGLGYDADANYIASATAVAVSYDNLSQALGLHEASGYFDPASLLVIAHPSFRAKIREVKDDSNNPVFVQGLAGQPDMLFGAPVKWSNGAKTSATVTNAPTGNPLLVVCNANYLILGVRSGPESIVIDGRDGASALTDETILKMRSRRGFAPGHPLAFSVLEDVA
jgi:HK97 family phage major capsid protein